jgi:hypothetical protein
VYSFPDGGDDPLVAGREPTQNDLQLGDADTQCSGLLAALQLLSTRSTCSPTVRTRLVAVRRAMPRTEEALQSVAK